MEEKRGNKCCRILTKKTFALGKSKKTKDPVEKWTTNPNREFPKIETKMAKKYLSKCSISLAIREMLIKTTLRSHLTLVRVAEGPANSWQECLLVRMCGQDKASYILSPSRTPWGQLQASQVLQKLDSAPYLQLFVPWLFPLLLTIFPDICPFILF